MGGQVHDLKAYFELIDCFPTRSWAAGHEPRSPSPCLTKAIVILGGPAAEAKNPNQDRSFFEFHRFVILSHMGRMFLFLSMSMICLKRKKPADILFWGSYGARFIAGPTQDRRNDWENA